MKNSGGGKKDKKELDVDSFNARMREWQSKLDAQFAALRADLENLRHRLDRVEDDGEWE